MPVKNNIRGVSPLCATMIGRTFQLQARLLMWEGAGEFERLMFQEIASFGFSSAKTENTICMSKVLTRYSKNHSPRTREHGGHNRGGFMIIWYSIMHRYFTILYKS